VGLGGNDKIWGENSHDRLHGRDGNDLILGRDGHDKLHGGNGDNYLDGGPSFDVCSALLPHTVDCEEVIGRDDFDLRGQGMV